MSFTKLNYCQYLLSSPINYTLTNLAEHLEAVSSAIQLMGLSTFSGQVKQIMEGGAAPTSVGIACAKPEVAHVERFDYLRRTNLCWHSLCEAHGFVVGRSPGWGEAIC